MYKYKTILILSSIYISFGSCRKGCTAQAETNQDEQAKKEHNSCENKINSGRKEIQITKNILEIELREEKVNAQRKMAWFSIISLVGYALRPLVPIVSEARLDAVLLMSDTLFIALASIVGFYFGATAYMSKKNTDY